MNWYRHLKGKVKLAEPLECHTTFKIGGPAKFFIEPKNPYDLRLLLNLAKRYKLPLFVIGRGSNLLISDKGINGVVLRLSTPYFNKLSYKGNYLEAGSGVSLSRIVASSSGRGFSGAEFLTGIPGTIGGALAMNAGVSEKVHGQQSIVHSIGDLVKDVTVMDYVGKIKTLHRKDMKFGYRTSSLSKYIILSTHLRLVRKDKETIKNRIKEYINYRKASQDFSRPSAGCIFRNPPGESAGRLIDLCGLKGRRVNGAGVSLKHANFILNLGRAQARDVIKLMGFIRKKVNNKFKIDLTPEIKIWR